MEVRTKQIKKDERKVVNNKEICTNKENEVGNKE
jgi:hypothetical protein